MSEKSNSLKCFRENKIEREFKKEKYLIFTFKKYNAQFQPKHFHVKPIFKLKKRSVKKGNVSGSNTKENTVY